jgi:hypothetical protein
MRKDDLSYSLGVFVVDVILVQLCFVSWALFAASIEVGGFFEYDNSHAHHILEEFCPSVPVRQRSVDLLHSIDRYVCFFEVC